MSIDNKVASGPNFVPSYQTSGVPFVTSSAADEVPSAADVNFAGTPPVVPIRVKFPFVTRFFAITNTGAGDLRVGFTEVGVQNPTSPGTGDLGPETGRHYFIVPTGSISSQRLEIRCTQLFFLSDEVTGYPGSFSLMAGMTGITGSNFPVITGSNDFLGVG